MTLHDRIANSFKSQSFMATMGARLVLVQDGEVHIELRQAPGLSQQQGFVHGGAIASVLDTACGYAALTKAPPGHEVVTAEFKINMLRPALGQRFLAIGRVTNAGRMLTVCNGEVRAFADEGEAFKVVAVMQATIAQVKA